MILLSGKRTIESCEFAVSGAENRKVLRRSSGWQFQRAPNGTGYGNMAVLENPANSSGGVPTGKQEVGDPRWLEFTARRMVEIKPLKDSLDTLNESGYNRGLRFSPDMRLLCGQRRRVQGRLDRIIVDGTGAMRQLRNTVCLEGSTCGCAYMGFGMAGCSRCELVYWRETWLRRCGPTEQTVR